MDSKKSILENVMVEFIRAVLEAVRRDFDYESMFRFLKTGLATDNQVELDRMENYVLALGIRGWKRWDSVWDLVYKGGKDLNLEELNEFRKEILGPIRILRESLKDKEKTVSSMTEGFWHVWRLSRSEKLEQYRGILREQGSTVLLRNMSRFMTESWSCWSVLIKS